MRFAIKLIGSMLCVSCACPTPTSDEWEYRVVAVHVYYGFDSDKDWHAAFLRGELMDHLSAAKNRWGAEGWDVAPELGELDENRLLLKRSRSNPAAFEVRFIMQQELAQASVESVQGRIDQLVRDGWTLMGGDRLSLEFHRAR